MLMDRADSAWFRKHSARATTKSKRHKNDARSKGPPQAGLLAKGEERCHLVKCCGNSWNAGLLNPESFVLRAEMVCAKSTDATLGK